MAKVLVIYHSQQFGDTKSLAEALAEGVRDAGVEAEIISTNERRVTLDEFLTADGVALGTPDYFSYLAGTIKTFFDDIYLWDKSGESVKGKPAALFFSHGSGGVKSVMESIFNRIGTQIGKTIGSHGNPTPKVLEQCKTLGRVLAESVT